MQTNKGSTYSFVADGKSYRLTWQWRLQGTTAPVNYRDLILAVGGTYSTEGGAEGVADGSYRGEFHSLVTCTPGI